MGLGLRTLLTKEVKRFMRVPGQTVLSPLITTTLYFVVFGFSLGSRLRDVEGVPYARFIVPGLVTLGVVSNAFLNTASSLFVMKLQGTIIDLLVSPLSYGEILAAFVGAAVLRGMLVGVVMWAVAGFFGGFELAHPLFAFGMLLLVAVAFASLGFVTAVWATSFEQINFFDLHHHAAHLPRRRLLLGEHAPPRAAPPHARQPGVLHGRRGAARDARPVRRARRGGGGGAGRALRGFALGRLRDAPHGV